MKINIFNNWIQKCYAFCFSSTNQIRVKNIIEILVFSLIVAISFFFFGPNIDSEWMVADDHEIIYFLGPDKEIGFKELIPTLLTKTEISPLSTLPRFRPVYYFFRLVETRLWYLNSPRDWYIVRIIIFIFFISVIYLFFKKINGQLIGALLAIFITTFIFWSDIFSRLGPSEVYAVLGVGIFLIGVLLFINQKESTGAWVMMMLGVLISIGSKENMIVILLPLFYIFFTYIKKRPKHNFISWLAVFVTAAWSIWICLNVYLRLKAQGSDIYQHPITLSEYLSIVLSFIDSHLVVVLFFGFLFLIGIIGIAIKQNPAFKNLFYTLFLGSAFILILLISQVIFYSGSIYGRYNFPYFLYIPFGISLTLFVAQSFMLIKKNRLFYIFITIISAIGLLFFIKPANWLQIREIGTNNAKNSHYFMGKIGQVSEYLLENSDTALIFYGNNPKLDSETILAFSRFLRTGSLKNQFFIFRDPPEGFETKFSDLSTAIEKRLLDFSENGNSNWNISPISSFSTDPQKCLILSLFGKKPASITCNKMIVYK